MSQPPHTATYGVWDIVKIQESDWNFQHLSSVVRPCNFSYGIFVNDDFLKKIFMWNQTVFYERRLEKKQILLLVTIINMLLSVLMRVDYRKVGNTELLLALSTADWSELWVYAGQWNVWIWRIVLRPDWVSLFSLVLGLYFMSDTTEIPLCNLCLLIYKAKEIICHPYRLNGLWPGSIMKC